MKRTLIQTALICMPILSMYGFSSWSFANILILVLGIYGCLKSQNVNCVPMLLLLLVADAAIVHIFTDSTFRIPLSALQVFLCYVAFWYFITPYSIDRYLSIYKKISIYIVIFFYIQYFSFHVLNYRISGVIPGLPIYENLSLDINTWLQNHNLSDRFSSLFSEPSYLCRFIIPLIVLEMYSINKINWKLVLFLSIPLLLTLSGTGILVFVALVLFWYLNTISYKDTKSIVKIFAVTIGIVITYFIVINSDIGQMIIDRQSEMNADYAGGSKSGVFRLWRGYAVFAEYPLKLQIFGTDNIYEIRNYEMRTIYGQLFINSNNFYNGLSTLLLRQGYIGLIIFLLFICQIWKKVSITGKAIVICYVVYMLCESVYPGERLASYLVIASCLTKINAKRLCVK